MPLREVDNQNMVLDKYADSGVLEIENIHILKVKPFDELGQPLEIANKAFGGRKGYDQALIELETELYSPSVRMA